MKIDVVKLEVNGIKLTAKEFQLVNYFIQNKGKVLTRAMIMKAIWDTSHQSNSIAVLIRAIRAKKVINIQTVLSVGYCYKGGRYEKSKLKNS